MSGEPSRQSVETLQAAGIILVEDGNHGENRPRPEEFSAEGEAFIRAADMDQGRVKFDTCSRISSAARSRIRKGVGAPRDILLSHKGTVGKLARVADDCEPFVCSPQTTLWRVTDDSRLDRNFLFYFMKSIDFTNQLKRVQGETDMAPYVSLTAQRRLTIPLPEIGTQVAMTRVLCSLDDKIALNRQMARTLEAIARALFQSWFVDLDPARCAVVGHDFRLPSPIAGLFPHAFTKDDLPEGWTRQPLEQLVDIVRTTVQPRDLPATTPYVGLEHIPKKKLTLDEIGIASDVDSQKIVFCPGDILFGKLRSYFHKVVVAPVNGICSSDILVMRCKDQSFRSLVSLVVSSEKFVERSSAAATGTRMPRADWAQMSSYEVVVPTADLLKVFNAIVLPMFERMNKLRLENGDLAALRDTLLPKLMSGELRAEHAALAAST